jgi:hypothetical protein
VGKAARLNQNPAPTMRNIMHGSHIRSIVKMGDVPVVLVRPLRFYRVARPRNGGDERVVAR